jgi:L,D-peptidoglycan transpeptidase YkuD (ErfK/YbiS/YcfS/YnhG family)
MILKTNKQLKKLDEKQIKEREKTKTKSRKREFYDNDHNNTQRLQTITTAQMGCSKRKPARILFDLAISLYLLHKHARPSVK